MPSSRHLPVAVALSLLALTAASSARAQQPAAGYSLDRFYPSAPGGGWFAMDALDMRGGLDGTLGLTVGYARNALRITSGPQNLAVVSNQATASVGFGINYDRWRWYLDLGSPLYFRGTSGTVGGYSYTAPMADVGSHPDELWDARIGMDVRLLGGAGSAFRLGACAQLFVPFGSREDYDTDSTVRGMVRILIAGDLPHFTYAAHVGAHIRPFDSSVPGSPRGSELLFGAAVGATLPLGASRRFVIGPEVWGATALRSFFSTQATELEALLSARIEGTGDRGMQVRVRMAGGFGVNQSFGAPEMRVLVGIEVFDHNQRR